MQDWNWLIHYDSSIYENRSIPFTKDIPTLQAHINMIYAPFSLYLLSPTRVPPLMETLSRLDGDVHAQYLVSIYFTVVTLTTLGCVSVDQFCRRCRGI